MNSTTTNNLWAITAYFNPSGYDRRRRNYRLFRQRLKVPLVTVELGYNDQFELTPDDADILIHVRSRSVLWQKERLLNIALQHVSASVRYVAWLDCDIIIEPTDWPIRAVQALSTSPIIQVFSRLYDLPRDVLPEQIDDFPNTVTSRSVAFKMAQGSSDIEDFRPTTPERRGLGFGWAARRELLDRHGLYDAFVLGSGDRAIACAAWGRFDDAIYQARLNAVQEKHYLEWAKPFFEDVNARVGHADATVFHLWHGDPEGRRYQKRHLDFSEFDFNPYSDLALNDDGCWILSANRTDLAEFVVQYFDQRREDGE